MTRLGRSSRGFSLFTPLVGTTLVIMAILIATTMIQNDVRISRTITASYEVSSQSMLAKLIKASAEVQMMTNMEEVTYDEVSRVFQCSDQSSCDSKISSRMLSTDKSNAPSVYTSLLAWDGIFANLVDSISTVLLGTGREYVLTEDATTLQQRFDRLITALDDPANRNEPFKLGSNSEGQYYIKINDTKFNSQDFVLEFEEMRTGNTMKLSIAPYGFNFTTMEPLYDLLMAEKAVFLNFDSKDSAKSNLESEFDSRLAEHVVSASFKKSDSDKRLKMVFYKGDVPGLTIIFQTSGFGSPSDFDYDCTPSSGVFNCLDT